MEKPISYILITAMLAISLCGCGTGGQDSGELFPPVSELPTGESSGLEEAPLLEAPLSELPASESSMPEEEIVVANLYGESSFLSDRVVNFDKENPAYGIRYLDVWGEEDATRVLMETANGEGPDVLYLSRKDLESLHANEALGEIGQLISEETRNALLPGAVQMGTYEDQLFAVPLSVYARSLLTSREYWKGDSWTTADILSVLEEHKKIEGLFLDISGADEYYYNLYFMIGTDIKNSPFLKDGNSGFDCQEFRNILTLIKYMTNKAVNNSNPMDRMLPLTEGEFLGIEYFLKDMKSYCDIYDKMGVNANLVGYPTDMGSSHYITDNGMLAVSRQGMEKEGVRALVNDLLGLESQKFVNYSISVRADIPESQLIYDEAMKSYIWMSPNNHGFLVPAKADGSSYLEEYVAFLKSAVPNAFDSDDIFEIVAEEADSYFTSGKDMEQVIDIIQRRVQNYLDERK